MPAPPRALFFGSGRVALPAIERLLDSGLVSLVAVVTTPPRPAGRKGLLTPTPVARLAAERGLPVLAPTSLGHAATVDALRALRPELIVLADYGRLIPPAVLELPSRGALNIHPSLLPRHRGAAPVQGAIVAGDRVTGVTLMRMDEGLDSGPILAQVEVPLTGHETAPQLEASLAQLGADLLVQTLPPWLDGRLSERPQPSAGASLTRPLRREDGRLDPTRPARELERLVRAYQPWPGTFIQPVDAQQPDARLKVWAAGVEPGPSDAPPGTLLAFADTLALVTVDGLLRLDAVQPAGGRRMTGAAYRRGRRGRAASTPA